MLYLPMRRHLNEKKRIRTTVDIPIELSERINKALHKKCAPSRNALLIQALQRYLEYLEQEEIDAQIAQMAADSEYQELHENTGNNPNALALGQTA